MLGAIIGAAASIGGALLGSSSQKKAAKRAANVELQVAEKNNALAREFRAANEANFQPNLQSGFRGNALIDSFLYGPQAPTATTQPVGQPVLANEAPGFTDFVPDYSVGMAARNGMGARNLNLARARATVPGQLAPQPVPNMVTTNALSQPVTTDAYETFRNSPYYQFPLREGLDAVQQGYAGINALQSGAALKDIVKYGEDYGFGRMGEYLGLAERQANRGITGASSIAGVSQNALNTMTQNNQNAADAAANAALLRGQANANMWSGVGNALGYASSYLPKSWGL